MIPSRSRHDAAESIAAQLAISLPNSRLRVGIDLVSTDSIANSLAYFGQRFLRRIFTADEIAYATDSRAFELERLAARFAAKEAALKAFDLADAGIPWTDFEVVRQSSGQCELNLRGNAQRAVRNIGLLNVGLSMSHENGFATAIVIAATN